MRGGAPLEWLRPLTKEGTRDVDTIGCYRGQFEHWNLKGARPGFTFRIVHKKNVARRQRMGWKVAKVEDGDAQLASETPMGYEAGMGGLVLETQNCVLMLAPVELVAKSQAMIAERTKQATAQIGADFVGRASGSELTFGQTAKRPIRFVD